MRAGDPVGPGMGETEPDRDDREGKPGERADRDGVEFLVDEIAQQESAPENLLDQRNDHDQPQETEDDRGPVGGWLAGKNFRIETVETRRETEELPGAQSRARKRRAQSRARKAICLGARNSYSRQNQRSSAPQKMVWAG